MYAISGMIYYVTCFAESNLGRGRFQAYLTPTGEWALDRSQAERFSRHDLAHRVSYRFGGAFVSSFEES